MTRKARRTRRSKRAIVRDGHRGAPERRIVVTLNVKDFPRICVEWAGAAKHPAGCLILVGIDHGELGTILRVIEAAFAARPDPAGWRDYAA